MQTIQLYVRYVLPLSIYSGCRLGVGVRLCICWLAAQVGAHSRHDAASTPTQHGDATAAPRKGTSKTRESYARGLAPAL
jgi:hypothetical protein